MDVLDNNFVGAVGVRLSYDGSRGPGGEPPLKSDGLVG